MKKFSLILSLVLISLLSSCKNEVSETITSQSQDGEMVITVQGKRSTSLDPYHVDVIVEIHDKKIESFTEVYADKITKENVHFNWSDNRHCVVSIDQRDGTQASIPISIED